MFFLLFYVFKGNQDLDFSLDGVGVPIYTPSLTGDGKLRNEEFDHKIPTGTTWVKELQRM